MLVSGLTFSTNITRGTTDPGIDSVTWIKFGDHIALVSFLATRWCHLHQLQIWPPDGATCIWYLHQPEPHQLSQHKVPQWVETSGPIDRTPGTPGSDNQMGAFKTLYQNSRDGKCENIKFESIILYVKRVLLGKVWMLDVIEQASWV